MAAVSQASLVLIGRYRLDAPLGRTSDGWFCRAHDLVLGRPVTVRMFESTVTEAAARTFAERAKSLASLRHGHVVALYDGGVADGNPYLVFEQVDGFDSVDATSDLPLSASDTANLGAGLADALAHMHAKGFVHGDLTLASVLTDANGQRRLMGFEPTQDGTAPADVHALGLVLRQCLSGRNEVRLNGTIPWPLARVLTAMTRPDPARRPGAAACARRLSQVAGQLDAGRRLPTAAAVRRGRVTGLAAVGGLVAVGAIAFASTVQSDQAGPAVAAPVPTMSSQFPLPDPTGAGTPEQPVPHPPLPTTTTRRAPTTTVRPTTSTDPTTGTQPPTTTATTTSEAPTTTTKVPPGLAKKPGGKPPGLLKKWFGLDDDDWHWPFDW